MQDLARAIRIAGIAVGLMFAGWLLWIVLIGPAVLVLMHPR
jgi:tetrahydromethanopterin S-methyltransferase subunit F